MYIHISTYTHLRSQYLIIEIFDDEAFYWISIGHLVYEAVAVGN